MGLPALAQGLACLPAFVEASLLVLPLQYRYGGQDCLARYWTVENETALVTTGARRALQPGRAAGTQAL
jgi:hypothetical protein